VQPTARRVPALPKANSRRFHSLSPSIVAGRGTQEFWVGESCQKKRQLAAESSCKIFAVIRADENGKYCVVTLATSRRFF
jgi:hypothetical protein